MYSFEDEGEGWYSLNAKGVSTMLGQRSDWQYMLEALRQKCNYKAKRCAIEWIGTASIALWCPRNATDNSDRLVLDSALADTLGAEIESVLMGPD